MKKINNFLIILFTIFLVNYSFAYSAGSVSSGSDGNKYGNLYKQGKKFVLRAKKLEKKNKKENA